MLQVVALFLSPWLDAVGCKCFSQLPLNALERFNNSTSNILLVFYFVICPLHPLREASCVVFSSHLKICLKKYFYIYIYIPWRKDQLLKNSKRPIYKVLGPCWGVCWLGYLDMLTILHPLFCLCSACAVNVRRFCSSRQTGVQFAGNRLRGCWKLR